MKLLKDPPTNRQKHQKPVVFNMMPFNQSVGQSQPVRHVQLKWGRATLNHCTLLGCISSKLTFEGILLWYLSVPTGRETCIKFTRENGATPILQLKLVGAFRPFLPRLAQTKAATHRNTELGSKWKQYAAVQVQVPILRQAITSGTRGALDALFRYRWLWIRCLPRRIWTRRASDAAASASTADGANRYSPSAAASGSLTVGHAQARREEVLCFQSHKITTCMCQSWSYV